MLRLAAAAALFLALPAAASPQAPVASAPPPAAAAARTIVGSVVSVDAAAGAVVVRESVRTEKSGAQPAAETVSVRVDAATQILRGKRTATLSDLRAGDHVVVRYTGTAKEGRALSVRVADAAPPAPTPSPAPPPG